MRVVGVFWTRFVSSQLSPHFPLHRIFLLHPSSSTRNLCKRAPFGSFPSLLTLQRYRLILQNYPYSFPPVQTKSGKHADPGSL